MGEMLSSWHERILEERGRDVAITAMGDFNGKPLNHSTIDHALAINRRARLTNARNALLPNLMWPVMGSGRGSHFDRPFNRGKADPGFTGEGYSDHFPISLIVEER